MTELELLSLARGPLFTAALVVFIAGMVLRLFEVLSLGRSADLSAARGSRLAGGLATIFSRTLPRAEMFRFTWLRVLNGYVFHLGLFVVVVFYGPHIAIFKGLLGISWPGLPSGIVDACAAITLISLIVALVFRLSDPVVRFISGPGDYIGWLVTFLPVLTGYLAYNHLFGSYTTMLSLHLLSVELFLVVAPFTRLTHMFSMLLSRWYQGAAAGHRGIAA